MVRVAAGVAVGSIRLQRGANNGFVLFQRLLDRQSGPLLRQGIRFTTILGFSYMAVAWGFVLLFPHLLLSIFTSDQVMIETGTPALHLYFFGFFFMAFQFAGQSTFTALGCAKRAIFFSLLRKVLIVVPLTLLLPGLGFGTNGVFLAEPISNLIGGLASFLTMYFTLYRKLPKEDVSPNRF